jgi:hypothetical protein
MDWNLLKNKLSTKDQRKTLYRFGRSKYWINRYAKSYLLADILIKKEIDYKKELLEWQKEQD